jgi:hypothetical protein
MQCQFLGILVIVPAVDALHRQRQLTVTNQEWHKVAELHFSSQNVVKLFNHKGGDHKPQEEEDEPAAATPHLRRVTSASVKTVKLKNVRGYTSP